MVGELKRAVLDKLGIEAAIGSIVDVLEEDTIHGGWNGSTNLSGVDVELMLRIGWRCHECR